MYRHVPKNLAETLRVSCKYCHKTPTVWQYVGHEKICVHCGTRVYHSAPMAADNNAKAYKAQ